MVNETGMRPMPENFHRGGRRVRGGDALALGVRLYAIGFAFSAMPWYE